MSFPRRALLVASLAGSFVATAAAQTEFVASGDDLGVGTVVGTGAAMADGNGSWVARGDFTPVVGQPAFAVVRDGAVWLTEGAPLAGTTGTLSGFVWADFNASGELVWAGDASLPTFMGPAAVLGYGDTARLVFGDPLLPAGLPGFGAGTFYVGLRFPDLNDHRRVLVRAVLEDPTVAGFGEVALVRLQLDATGAVVAETLVAAVGDALAGGVITALADDGRFAGSNADDALYWAALDDGRELIVQNGIVLAESATTAPTGGTWIDFGPGLARNEAGDIAFAGTTQEPGGPTAIVVKNGATLVQEGAPLPGRPGTTFLSLDGERIELAADGRTAFAATWFDAVQESGILIDGAPAVRFGVTQIGALVVTGLATPPPGVGGALRARADGSLVASLTLSDGSIGAYLLTVDGALEPIASCAGNVGTLTATGSPSAGDAVTFTMDAGQAPGVTPFLAFATQPATAGPCGLAIAGGELLLAPTAPNPIVVLTSASPWTGAPVAFQTPLPLSIYGATLYAQGLFADLAAVAPGEPLRLTDGFEVVVGL